MIIVKGEMRFAGEGIESLRPAIERIIAASRGEAGCAAYSCAVDLGEPGTLRVSGLWSDEASVGRHMQSSHMAEFMRALSAAKPEAVRFDAYEAHFLRTLIGEPPAAGD